MYTTSYYKNLFETLDRRGLSWLSSEWATSCSTSRILPRNSIPTASGDNYRPRRARSLHTYISTSEPRPTIFLLSCLRHTVGRPCSYQVRRLNKIFLVNIFQAPRDFLSFISGVFYYFPYFFYKFIFYTHSARKENLLESRNSRFCNSAIDRLSAARCEISFSAFPCFFRGNETCTVLSEWCELLSRSAAFVSSTWNLVIKIFRGPVILYIPGLSLKERDFLSNRERAAHDGACGARLCATQIGFLWFAKPADN